MAATIAVAVATVVALVVLYPREREPFAQEGFAANDAVLLGVIERLEESAAEDDTGFTPPGAVNVRAVVRLESGEVVVIDSVDQAGTFEVGLQVEVARVSAPGLPEQFSIVDIPRGASLALLVALFVGVVIAFGRLQGLAALVGLAAAAVVIVGWMVPTLLSGREPVVVAVVAAMAVMLVTLPLAHGLSAKTMAAAIGTAAALVLTAGLAWLFVEAAHLTGLASEEAQSVLFVTGRPVDLRGLLLAGIIIGCLGVLDDVTVSQASTAFELRRANPAARPREVYTAALRVGRDHVAATVNTLVLAYAGAALPLLLLFVVGGEPLGGILSSELVAVEIIRSLVGSIGLVAAVPITTALAAAAAVRPARSAPMDAVVPEPAAPVVEAAEPHLREPPPSQPPPDDGEDDAWEKRLRAAYRLDPRGGHQGTDVDEAPR